MFIAASIGPIPLIASLVAPLIDACQFRLNLLITIPCGLHPVLIQAQLAAFGFVDILLIQVTARARVGSTGHQANVRPRYPQRMTAPPDCAVQ